MEKTKPLYSLGSNVVFSLSMHWREKKSTVIFCAVAILMRVALPFIGILIPKLVIDELEAAAAPLHFIIVIGAAAALLVLLNFIKNYTDEIVDNSIGTIGSYSAGMMFQEKQITMDYELMEDPELKTLEDKVMRAGANNHTPALNMPRALVRLIVNILGFLLYGSVIVSIHPLILLLLVISAVINWFCLSSARKYEKETRDNRSQLDRKLHYLQGSMKNPSGAKDIRLYSMFDWLHGLAIKLLNDKERAEGKVATRDMLAQLADGVLILIRDGAAYVFLIYLLLHNQITLGNFVFVFAAIGAFATWVSGIILQTSEIFRASSEISDIRVYFDIPDKSNVGPGAFLPSDTMLPPGISLRNVGYTYPKAEAEALKDINIEIKPGERIAVVGANGAGKTTLVKLICGLYQPKTGTISLGGMDIGKYNRDEYFTLFSTVFQDIHLLTTDISGNISQATPEYTDDIRIRECLRLSGLYDMVQALPGKEETMLVRQVNDDAIELSGGEKQKLALARALYKDAPVIILDEPTAALDPIAENEVYQKYAELTKGKTSIYISHRLASTRFCDRILFIDDHTIAEDGMHDELMRLGGKYAHMFEVQSHYYKNSGEVELNA